MYKELTDIQPVDEVKEFFNKHSYTEFFTDKEIQSVQNKDIIKSLGARYFIKKSILEYFKLRSQYHNIEIINGINGKPEIILNESLSKVLQDNIQVSISHSRNYITTLVIIEHV